MLPGSELCGAKVVLHCANLGVEKKVFRFIIGGLTRKQNESKKMVLPKLVLKKIKSAYI